MQVHDRFQERGVGFVSLSIDDLSTVRAFVEEFGVSWVNGYNLSAESTNELGGYSSSVVAGYELTPTILVLDGTGTVLWTDRSSRYAHADPEEIAAELAQAIGKALGDDDT